MSYADMITILMAFFVVMYSMAGTPDEAKEEAVFRSLARTVRSDDSRLASDGARALCPDRLANGSMDQHGRRTPPKQQQGRSRKPRTARRTFAGPQPQARRAGVDRRNGLLRRRLEHADHETKTTTTNHRRGTRGQTTKNRNPGTHLAPATAGRCPVSRQLGPGLQPLSKRPGLSHLRWDSIQDAFDSAWPPKTNRPPAAAKCWNAGSTRGLKSFC